MLVYANVFLFSPDDGPQDIVDVIARWAGRNAGCYVDPELLAKGVREYKMPEGRVLHSIVSRDDEKNIVYPYYFSARLTHGDDSVSGRQWITEIGLYQESIVQPVTCSVLLKTDEVSTRVVTLPEPSRPNLVSQLIERCNPIDEMVGLTVTKLDESSALAFFAEVESERRNYPLVIVSCNANGEYPVDLQRLQSLLVGLAKVVDIPLDVDTYRLEMLLGRRYIAFGGAINIIFPARKNDMIVSCESKLLRSEFLEDLFSEGKDVKGEVFGIITHRTNLPASWRHISPEVVNGAILRRKLAKVIEGFKAGGNDDSLEEYKALFEEAARELQEKDALKKELEEKKGELQKVLVDNEALKYSLSERSKGVAGDDGIRVSDLRSVITPHIVKDISVIQTLKIFESLYSERLVVLDSAYASAKESDRAGFRYGKNVFDLLYRLITDYWEVLTDGRGDQDAKTVFGQNEYAANESSVLSNDGVRRRTFVYNSMAIKMLKHLKYGYKDSLAETIRIHFEWFDGEQKIVIGHCGKHLDF